MTRPSSPWPKGARCAVMLTFDFDAETLWLARDPRTADLPGEAGCPSPPRLGADAHHARSRPQARDVPLLEPDGRRLPVPPPRRASGGGAARPVGARRRALLPDAPAPGAPAHAEPGGDLRRLARRVPRLLRVRRALQPHVPSSSHRPPLAAPHAAPADPLREASPWRLVGDRERGRRALAPPQGSALVTCRNEDRPGLLPERLGQGCGPSRVHVEVHAELLERGDPLTAPLVGHHRSEEHTSELQSRLHLVCRLL